MVSVYNILAKHGVIGLYSNQITSRSNLVSVYNILVKHNKSHNNLVKPRSIAMAKPGQPGLGFVMNNLMFF